MKAKTNNQLLFLLFSAAVGGVFSVIIWAFLKVMQLGITLLWEIVPQSVPIPSALYTIALCLLGGLAIGLLHRFFGDFPEELNRVMSKVKREKRYPYHNIPIVLVMAVLPLIFGGSIGPEAGLTGVVVGLCYWAGDRFRYAGKNLRELTNIGVSAALSVIFRAPLFGFMMPIEQSGSEEDAPFPKSKKLVTYFVAILAGVGVFELLSSFFGGGLSMPRFEKFAATSQDCFFAVILAAAGVLLGLLFFAFERFSELIVRPLVRFPILKGILGGLALSACGILLPMTMFSGDEQTARLTDTYGSYAAGVLIVTAVVKMFITNFCIKTGWKGGHFFPAIFSGVCLGYGLSLLLPVTPVFSVCVVTAASMGMMMKKPVCAALLLMLCFPAQSIVWLLAAAFAGSLIPVPPFLKSKENTSGALSEAE